MPVSLSEWRVRIGTFVHWIREYEVNERRERLLKERIRRLKVLCERLEAKRGDSGEVFEDDKSRQDDPDPKGCPHKTANIRSSGNSSDIKELLTSCDQCIQDLLTASDSHIKEILTPSGSSIKELITPNECSIRSLNSLNGPTIKDIITPNDSGIKELVSTNDSRIKNLVKANDDSGIQDLVKANDDSRIQDLLTSNYSSTGTCIRNPITPRYCSIKDVIVSRNADSQPLDTPNDSSTKELTSLNASSIKDLITPSDSSIIDLITSEYSNVKELITSNDSKIDSLLSPNKTNIKQLIQPDDDYIEEQLARKCTSDDESIEHDTQVGDSEEQHMSDFSISPRHSLSDASVKELLTSSNSSMKDLRTPTDDLNAYLIIKTSNIKDHETQSDGSVNELPSPGSGTTLCRPFAPCDDLLVELLKPTVSASKDLLSIDFCCHEPDRQNEPFSEKSRKLPHFMGKDHYPQPDTFTKEATDDEVLKEHHKSSGSCKSQTDTSILMAFERSPVVVPFISRKYCISDRYGEKQMKESASSCHGPFLKSKTDLISGQIPPLSEFLLLKSGDVELNPGPREEAGWSWDLEMEMHSLVKDVPLGHYCILCNALDVSYAQSKEILSENFNDVPASLLGVICNWGYKHRDDTKCRRLIAEKLRSVHLDALGTKLVEGGYSKQDTPTQSSVTDEVHPVNKFTQEEDIRAVRRSDSDKELLSLVEDVSPVHYLELCNALDVSNLQSQLILTQNLFDVSNSLFEVICRWRVEQRDGTNYKRLLAEKLRSVHLDELGTKLVKGGYSSQDTPTQSLVTDEVHPENKLTQEEDIRDEHVRSLDFERELWSLVQDVSPVHYVALCKALDVSNQSSQMILTQHRFDVSISLFEVIMKWVIKQTANPKRLLAEKLRSVHLDALGTKLVEGGYSKQDTSTQSSVTDEVLPENELTQDEDFLWAGRRSDLGKELLSLVEDVSPVHYSDLCNALEVSYTQSQTILKKNLMDMSKSLYEVIDIWRVKQRDGTNYKILLAEKLRSVHLDALATKLVKGGYSSQDTPTQSSVADEVHPVNKLMQEEDFRAVWGLDFERELLYLVKDVSPIHYYALCKALDVSDKKSQMILRQNLFVVSNSLFEVICRWRVEQRDGTNYKRLLAEKLRSVRLDALATKLVKGGYSTHDTPTQSLVADEVHPVNKLTQEEVIRAWWSSDLEKELLSLIKDVSPVHYYDLCKVLDISDKQSKVILTQNRLDVSNSLYEVIYSWRVKQRDGTNYKRFLAEKLRTVHLDALATKLVEGGYSAHDTPTQSSVADEVHGINKLTQEESLLFEEALMARKESPTKESEKPVESVDDVERVNCFGFTEELSANLLDTKVLTINVEAPEEHEGNTDNTNLQ